MKYKAIGLLIAMVFVVASTAGVGLALYEEKERPIIEGSVTYDPVTVHADVVDLANLDEVVVYFRYREKGREGWTETEKRTMSSEGTYSKILTDIDPDTNYDFQVVVEWIGDEDLIFETERKPAEFQMSGLRAVPEKVYIDEHTSLRMDIENIGGQPGETAVGFVVNEKTEISETVSVDAGETKTVSVSYLTDNKGTYRVDAEGMTTYFEVHDLPSVEAKYAKSITHDSAVLVADLTNIGLEESVDVYFRYRTEENGWEETPRQEMYSEGRFSHEVSGLDIDSDYRFRAVVEWDDRHRVGESKFIETSDIEVRPNAVTDTYLRGVDGVGVFFWGQGTSLSSDITEYRWDFYGDGDWDYVSSETGKTIHTYSETGTYNAVFEVEDHRGRTDSQDVEVVVAERKYPMYEVEDIADGFTRDVYFDTEYLYDQEDDQTRIALNIKNTASERRNITVTIDIPKDVASSIEDMDMFPAPTEILEENPEVVWNFVLEGDETGRFEMAFDGHIEPGRFDEMRMVQAYGEEQHERRTITGLFIRGITRIWGFIVILIVAIALVLVFVGSDRFRETVFRSLSRFEQMFLAERETDEQKKTRKKEELDRRFIDTARSVKKALRRDDISNPHRVVDRLEMANDALDRGNISCFEQYIGEVQRQINRSTNNVAW